MVGSHYHKGVSVFFGPLKHVADRAVKVKRLFHCEVDTVGVQPVVDAGAFKHGHEALLAALGRQKIKATRDHMAEQVSTLGGNGEIVIGHQAQHRQGSLHKLLLVGGVVVALGFHFGHYVTTVVPFGTKVVASASGYEIYSAVDVVGNKAVGVVAAGVVAAKVAGSGVGKVAYGYAAGFLT